MRDRLHNVIASGTVETNFENKEWKWKLGKRNLALDKNDSADMRGTKL